MLRTLLRFLSPSPDRPAPIDTSSGGTGNIVLYARVAAPDTDVAGKRIETAARVPESVSHRARLMSMHLEHTRLCSAKRCDRLGQLGIVTAGDLASADLNRIAAKFAAPTKALRVLKRYRRALRLAASVPGMMPRDALLLIAIHRRSVRGLAGETPAALHRDLLRFAESTSGRRQLRGRRVPSTRRIRRWISACESNVRNAPGHVPA